MNRLQSLVAGMVGLDREIEQRVAEEVEKRGGFEVYLEAWRENARNAESVVTTGTSMQIAAVWACVRVLAETISSLPLLLYKRTENGKERAQDYYLYELLHDQPNPLMTSMQFREVLQTHLAINGNAYARIFYDGAGRIEELWPLNADSMLEKKIVNGRRYYNYQFDNGKSQWFSDNDIWHIPGPGWNGLDGFSPVALMRRGLGLAMDAEDFGARFFQNDARPGIILEHPGKLGDAAIKNLQESWKDDHQGVRKSHKLKILEEGMKLHEVGIPPEDAQFLETRQFQVREIARMFRIPPHMIGDLENSTFSNIEHQGLEFVVHTIRPWLVRWEQSIRSQLMLPRERAQYFPEHLVDGLLRGDIASRYQAYAVGRQNGWLSANDIRSLENMNKIDNGDMYLVPLNMIPADQLGEMDKSVESVPDAPVTTAGNSRALDVEIEERSRKTAAMRHRIALAQRGVIQDAAERVMRREVKDVGAAIGKYLGKRDSGQFLIWLDEFYQEHAGWFERQMLPILTAFAEMVMAEAQSEVNSKDDLSDQVKRFIRSYTATFAAQQAGISLYRLKARMQDAVSAGKDPEEELRAELDEWQQKRPGEMAQEQSSRAGNAVAKVVYMAAGVSILRWVTMGDTCPYCKSMDGRKVSITQFFVPSGNKVDGGEGVEPMAVTSNVGHPPLHGGCDCMIVAG